MFAERLSRMEIAAVEEVDTVTDSTSMEPGRKRAALVNMSEQYQRSVK